MGQCGWTKRQVEQSKRRRRRRKSRSKKSTSRRVEGGRSEK